MAVQLALRRSTRLPLAASTSTPVSGSRSANALSRPRKRSRTQDEPEHTMQPRSRLTEPTPRAIRALKRRKLADDSICSTPHPQPISPEPSSSSAQSTYVVKSRKRKSQFLEDDAASSTGSDSPTIGDPLPRSLTKRRKVDRTPRPRSKSSISTPPSKNRTRPRPRPSKPSSIPLPRGPNNKHNVQLRRSARLGTQSQYPSEAQLEVSIPLSPLTPPPEEDDEPTDDTEEDDDSEMEMVASINSPSSTWKSIIPSHISNPILKGRLPPNPALYAQLQLASYKRTKPNTPSPLSLYSYTGGATPPTSPALSATTTEPADDIPPLGESDATVEGEPSSLPVPEQLFNEPQIHFYGQGYSQVESQQQQSSSPPQQQIFEQGEYTPPAQPPTPTLVDMGLMMMDLHFMQLQQGSMQFGVDQMGFIMPGGNAADGTLQQQQHQHMPTTVHMQDVHLPHDHHQNQNQLIDIPNQQIYPSYPYFSTTTPQQQQQQEGYTAQPGVVAYSGESQAFQPSDFQSFQPQYHHQEGQSYEPYGVYQQPYQTQAQQDFQDRRQHPQTPFDVAYDAGAYQASASPSTPSAAAAADLVVSRPMAHYTLSMQDAVVYFREAVSRFREEQSVLAREACEVHARQLEEFQREKEERKRRLKRTRLVMDLSVVQMGSPASAAAVAGLGFGAGVGSGRARGLWAVACKARMFEVVRIYTPGLIREVTEICAREYSQRMGIKYPPCQPRYQRISVSEDETLVDCDGEGEADEDGFDADEEFRKEKIFDFELLDDDEECEEMEVDMEEVEDEDYDEDDEEEEDDEEDDEQEDDPLFQSELSMQIVPQEPTPSTCAFETTFYVPPPVEVYAHPEPEDAQEPKLKPKPKVMLVNRPVLPLPPPRLASFRSGALRVYNVDPVLAGRGTPCVKERRDVWGSSASVSVRRGVEDTEWDDAYSERVGAKEVEGDSVFGDCAGVCCMTEGKGKGKMKAVEEGALSRVEEASTFLAPPSQPIVESEPLPSPPTTTTVEIPPSHSDNRIPIPHGRRGVMGRMELLKVYSPPMRSVPSVLPVTRRPPRPPPPFQLQPQHQLDTPRRLVESESVEGEAESSSNPPPQQQQQPPLVQSEYHAPVVPYSWEQVSQAMEVLAYQGIDASAWVDAAQVPLQGLLMSPLSPGSGSGSGLMTTSTGLEGGEVRPTFNPSSSELSAALG